MVLTSTVVSNWTSVASAAIAAAALVISIRAQRANYRLAQKVADQAGRLRSVEILRRDEPSAGFGFKAQNGPSEVTITDAIVQIIYIARTEGKILHAGRKVYFSIRADEFELVGITGPQLGFRLAPYDQAHWRMPISFSEFPFSIRAEQGYNDDQHIEFRFSVTASGDTKVSEPYTLGFSRISLLDSTYHFEETSLISLLRYQMPDGMRNWLLRVLG